MLINDCLLIKVIIYYGMLGPTKQFHLFSQQKLRYTINWLKSEFWKGVYSLICLTFHFFTSLNSMYQFFLTPWGLFEKVSWDPAYPLCKVMTNLNWFNFNLLLINLFISLIPVWFPRKSNTARDFMKHIVLNNNNIFLNEESVVFCTEELPHLYYKLL